MFMPQGALERPPRGQKAVNSLPGRRPAMSLLERPSLSDTFLEQPGNVFVGSIGLPLVLISVYYVANIG